MARVCTDIYPANYLGQGYNRFPGFFMENGLKSQLDILIKNIVNDWDFTILITGGGEVRVGKSVLAMQIAAYWAHQMKEVHKRNVVFNIQSFVFDGSKLIETGNNLGTTYPNSPLIYDEAGADLAGTKVMNQVTQDVLDYFRECGQWNMLNVLVLPDFFDLPKAIAITRSIFLIDVDYSADENGIFRRGEFKFYSRPNKKMLYLKGKKELNYKAFPYDFRGKFMNFYPINEAEYRNLKVEALKRRESKRRNQFQLQRDACWYILHKEIGWEQSVIAKRMEQLTGRFVARETVRDGILHFAMENE